MSSITRPLTHSLTVTLSDAAQVLVGKDVPYPAPVGYRWRNEAYNGIPTTFMGQNVYYLERIV